MNCAYVTLVSNDEYIWGAICLGISFQKLKNPSKYPFVIMVSEKVSQSGVDFLRNTNIGKIIIIPAKEYKIKFSHYATTRQKMEIFKLIEYDRICFMDADCIIINNLDKELENHEALFGLRNIKECPELKEGHLRGEGFIITPNILLYNVLDKIYNNFKTDEECLNFIYNNDFLVSNTFTYDDILLKAIFHFAGPDFYKSQLMPKYPTKRKYWQQYDMNYELANNMVEYFQSLSRKN